ncbi:MAG: RNA-binding S4 domain-containing protein [Verrucomicrobiota bacterium]
MDSSVAPVRIDKWLWAVRLYKSRCLATNACATDKIKINNNIAKPSRSIKPGDLITGKIGEIQRTIRVLALLEKRVGAKLVGSFMEDLTPPEEFSKAREKSFNAFVFRREKKRGRD